MAIDGREPRGSQSWHRFCSDIARSFGDIMSKPLIVELLLISAAPAYAQNQQTDPAKLKTDAQKVVSIISRDRLKIQTYCQILELSDQIDQDENPANFGGEIGSRIHGARTRLIEHGPRFSRRTGHSCNDRVARQPVRWLAGRVGDKHRCPLWVKKRTSAHARAMSALPPKPDPCSTYLRYSAATSKRAEPGGSYCAETFVA